MTRDVNRRDFLRVAGATAIAAAMAGPSLPSAPARPRRRPAEARAQPKTLRPVKLGFIALTDCASLVMAKELGYFADRDLDVTLEKQASWPATRDDLLTGQIDGAHCLFEPAVLRGDRASAARPATRA